ncbi:MAG TPA: class II aldolase/adducin family protein [Chryseolinea sp.]|jgi:ribulose-5-phosphate 4-epimerase/fuculose-1-phosphate aldolase|nr:class II aldolase/adducin family protein [Chryseolinea sp.]
MNDEGVIKFNCQWTKSAPLDKPWISDLNVWRDKLYSLGLIGLNEDGIGYGNISIRFRKNQFIISGSGTGKFKKLTEEHYALVTDYDVRKNSLCSTGSTIASSESLTHAMIYEHASDVNAVIHVHHFKIWKKLLSTLPATAENIEYGTPEMANEIVRLFNEQKLSEHKIFAMAGHYEGIVCFGENLSEAAELLLNEFRDVNEEM